MKRVILACLFLAIIMAMTNPAAANPITVIPAGKLQVGVDTTYMTKQDVANDVVREIFGGIHTRTLPFGYEIENDLFSSATVTYGLTDRVNVYAKLGLVYGGELYLSNTLFPIDNMKGDLGTGFRWGIGAKGKVFELRNGLSFGLCGQYLRFDNRSVDNWRFPNNNNITAAQDGWRTDDHLDYWQLDFVATAYWKLDRFTPYIGAGYSYGEYTYDGNWVDVDDPKNTKEFESNFHAQHRFTSIVGFDFDIIEKLSLNVQGTFVSRTAITAALTYGF